MYTKRLINEKPKKKSEMINITRGMVKAIFLLKKFSPLNNAIAVTGEKFGGWGIILEMMPNIINTSTSFSDCLKFKFISLFKFTFSNIHFFTKIFKNLAVIN